MRAIAKRSEHVWLVTNEAENPPTHAQVLDLSIGRLFPPYPYASILKNGEWEKLPFGGKNADVDRMLAGIEVMPSQQDVLDGQHGSRHLSVRWTGESCGVTAFRVADPPSLWIVERELEAGGLNSKRGAP